MSIESEMESSSESDLDKMELEEITDKKEIERIIEKYFSEESDVDGVVQAFSKVYEGKPVISEGFVQCTAMISFSERTLSLIHIEPFSNGSKKIPRDFKKYFPREEPISVLYLTRKGNRAEELHHDYAQSSKPWSFDNVEKLNFELGEESGRWDIALDPEEGVAYIRSRGGEETLFARVNLPIDKYDHNLHEESGEVYDNLDYMTPLFRKIEAPILEMGYKVEEDESFDFGIRDLNVTTREFFHDFKGEIDQTIFVYHNDGEMTEIDYNSEGAIKDLVKDVVGDNTKEVYLIKVMKYDYYKDEGFDGKASIHAVDDYKL